MSKGKLIVIDGTDGSGKATQAEILARKLKEKGFKVNQIAFPRHGNKSSALVDDYLNGEFGTAEEVGSYRASLFYAIDRYAASFEIRRWLSDGNIVIADRYVSANMGHQAGKIKDKEERDKFLDWLEDLEYNIFHIPIPDISILLKVSPGVSQQLIEKKEQREYIKDTNKDIHEEDLDHLKDSAEAFVYVANKYNWNVIDCSPDNKIRTKDEISEEVWRIIEKEI